MNILKPQTFIITPDTFEKSPRTSPDALKKRTVSGEKRTYGNPI